MSISAVGTPLVPVRIGDKVYNFWLDTGSSLTMLASDVAMDLGVKPLVPDTLEIVTSTGRVRAQPALVQQLVLGPLVVENVPTMIVEETSMQMQEPRQHGSPYLSVCHICSLYVPLFMRGCIGALQSDWS